MGLFFAPVANVVLGASGREEEGQASGANNAIRELGGVFGVAVLASIFARYGGYGSGERFTDGIVPAVWVGAMSSASARSLRSPSRGAAARRGRGASHGPGRSCLVRPATSRVLPSARR